MQKNHNFKSALQNSVFNTVSKAASNLKLESYVIGGFVRDYILKRGTAKDIDIVAIGSGINLAKQVAKNLPTKPKVQIFKTYGTAMLRFEDIEIEFVGARKESYNEDKVNFEAYQAEYDHFLLASRSVIDISSINDKEDAKEEMLVNSFGSFEASINELDLLIYTNNSKAQQAANYSGDIYTSASRLILGMSLLSFIAGVIVAVFIVRSLRKQIGGEPREIATITHKVAQGDLSMHFEGKQTGIYASVGSMVKNMREINQITNKIAEGSLIQRLKIRSDKDQLAISINQMIDNFKDIINKAKVIAKGDYSIDIEQRGEQDELGSALRQMTLSLRQNKKDTDEQNWIKDGVSRLSQALSGNISLTELSQTAISFLARYTNSAQGALYIYNEKEETLNLYGSFAFTERNTLSNAFKKGEGIIGQVALEGNPILLKNIRRQDFSISTGTITEPPLNSYCLPLIFENELYRFGGLSAQRGFNEDELFATTRNTTVLEYRFLLDKNLNGLLNWVGSSLFPFSYPCFCLPLRWG